MTSNEHNEHKVFTRNTRTTMDRTYKTSDIILIDDEYCSPCIFFSDRLQIRYYVNTKCPFCDKTIQECIGLIEDFKNKTRYNEIVLTEFFEHIRKLHSDNFITIKNIETDLKKLVVKYTLVKKVIL